MFHAFLIAFIFLFSLGGAGGGGNTRSPWVVAFTGTDICVEGLKDEGPALPFNDVQIWVLGHHEDYSYG